MPARKPQKLVNREAAQRRLGRLAMTG